MNIFINILVALACVLLGYTIGSANISIPLGKLFFKQDPRDYGSHNVGATNCGRLWGKKWFFFVFLFDTFKTIAPLFISWAILTFVPMNNGNSLLPDAAKFASGDVSEYVIQWPVYWMSCIGALLGNIFPIFIGFKGGKAASTYLGLTILTSWALSVCGLITYMVSLYIKRYVSLSSIITGIQTAILAWVWAILTQLKVIPTDFIFFINWMPLLYCNYVYAITFTVLVAVMVYRHHENIGRLIAGNERKIHWMDSKKKVNN